MGIPSQSLREPQLVTMVDLGECNIKLCHSLGPPSEDLPNWRRVPGFPVYGVGQPTEKGFAKIPEKIGKEKTIWFNCRQEPVAYVNGVSVTARSKKNPHANIESNDCLEDKLVSTIEGKQADGKVKLTKDKAEADNPMDREEEDEDHPAVDLKDSYLMGEFDVIKELLEKLPPAKEGKILADKMIDN